MNTNYFPTGMAVYKTAKATFNTDKPTAEQVKYVVQQLIPSSYLLAHHTLRGHGITFNVPNRDSSNAQAHRPWQVDIINDQHPDKIIIKSRQLGLSEIGVAEMLWFADRYSEYNVKCLYTFPTNRQLKTFIKTRLDPVLAKGYYSTLISDKDNTQEQKKIRNSFLIFRSSSKAGAVEGIDIDYLSLDEYDRVPKQAEDSAIESMSSSKFKYRRRWSTPTIPHFAIHDLYEHSDMKEYLHKCEHCGYWNKLEYKRYDPNNPDNSGNIKLINKEGYKPISREVDDGTFQFVCKKCGKLLDRWYNGQWVAKHPDIKGTSGYLISQLNAVWVSADDLVRKELNAKSRQTFHNYVLGEPYQDLSLAVVPRDIVDMRRPYLPKPKYDRDGYELIVASIDWGVRHSCIIIGITATGEIDILRMLSIPETTSYDDINADVKKLVQELRLYEPDMILADLGYQGTRVNQLINAFGKDRVYGVQVKPTLSNGEVKPVWNDDKNTVVVDKLTNNIAMINMVKTKDIGIYSEDDEMQELFIEHMQNIVIRDEEDEDTGDLKKIITRKGGDHLGQALMMALVGLRRILDERGISENSAFKYTSLSPVDTNSPTGEEYYGNQLVGLDGNELGSPSSSSIFD